MEQGKQAASAGQAIPILAEFARPAEQPSQ
jgi:hypothetical protein